MKFTYGPFDAHHAFRGQDALFPSFNFLQFVLQYGQEGLEALDDPDADERIQALVEQMIDAGLLERDDEGRLRPTPRTVKSMEARTLLEIFRDLRPGYRGEHRSPMAGRTSERTDGTRPYEYGDPVGEIDAGQTLRNAIQRALASGVGASRAGAGEPLSLLPLRLIDRDFELHNTESVGETAIVVLLDLSGSMIRYGRFLQAKRVALGLKALVERRFPTDSLQFIGFSSVAAPIRERDLTLVMPRPIATRQWQVRIRVPLEQASEAPQHFTNLHHALRLARVALARTGARNKQIFIVTDGQPTAHVERADAPAADMLHLIYPPSDRTWQVTLEEAYRCAQADIRLSTFALIEEYESMDWVGFVEQMTRLTRGVAFYCTAGDLPGLIVESYLSGKRRKTSAAAGAFD